MNSKKTNQFDDLQKHHLDGLFTDAEFFSKTLELLGCGDDSFWYHLPSDIRKELSLKVAGFSEGDELISFGAKPPNEAKNQLFLLLTGTLTI